MRLRSIAGIIVAALASIFPLMVSGIAIMPVSVVPPAEQTPFAYDSIYTSAVSVKASADLVTACRPASFLAPVARLYTATKPQNASYIGEGVGPMK